MQTLYERLKDEFKSELENSTLKYDSAKRIKYTLMSKNLWQELTINELSELITYTNQSTYKISPSGFMYGANILNADESIFSPKVVQRNYI